MSAHPIECVTPEQVIASLGCSRATAYRYMRRALRRVPGAKGLLRVPVEEWRRYVETVLQMGGSWKPVPASVVDVTVPRVKWGPTRGVYFVGAAGLIKIGHAKCVNARMSALQCGCPIQLHLALVIDGGRDREQELHDRFRHLRQHGEWFVHRGELAQFIARGGVE